MISSTFGGYMTAKLGLSAAQQGLYLTGQNLTNAGTEGYTRQRLDQVSINYGATYRYASKYNPNIGNGVLVKGTTQLRDPFLDLRYRNEVAHTAEQGVKLDVLNDLRDILDEVKNAGEDSLGDGGIFNQLGDIIEKFKTYSSEIGSKEFDSMIKSSCQSLVTLFNSYSKRIDEVSYNLNYDLENADIPRVNKILESIQELNKNIKNSEIIGQPALELKDQRNLLIDELSEYMKINVTYKPINVTATTVVDELHIALVGQDGKNYEIIADEQRREFLLSKDGDKSVVGLGALTPVDQELKAELNTALLALDREQQKYENRNKAFSEQYKNFSEVQAERDRRDKALADYKANEETYLKEMQEASQKYIDALTAYSNLPKEEQTAEKLQEVTDAATKREEAVNKYNELIGNIRWAENRVEAYKSVYAGAEKNYKDALADLDVDPNPLPKMLDADGNETTTDITTDLLTGQALHGDGLAAKRLEEAKNRVTNALDALKQSEENGKPIESVNELLTDGKLKGTLEMLNYSAEFDDPPNTIRGIGYYKSMLDTLANRFAEAMNEANNPYEFQVQKTDENGKLVYKNYAYNEDSKTYEYTGAWTADGKPTYATDSKGNPLYEKDKNGQIVYIEAKDDQGNPIYEKEKVPARNENGDIIYETNPDGSVKMDFIRDENGVPVQVPVYEEGKDKYGEPILGADGKPVMVLAYEIEKDADGNEIIDTRIEKVPKKDADGNIMRNPDNSIIYEDKTVYEPRYVYEQENGQNKLDSDGNPIRIVKRETRQEPVKKMVDVPVKVPAPAKEAVMETVQNEGGTERHDLFKSRDGNKITAGTIDLADGWVDNSYGITTSFSPDAPSGNNDNVLHFINMLNGKMNYKADVNLLDGIKIDFNDPTGVPSKEPNVSGMKQGDTITIDGKVYTFVPGATGQVGNEFKDFDTLKIAAEKNGVALSQDADGKITAETLQKDLKYDVQLNGAPIGNLANINVNALSYGDTITIDGKTFTYKPATYPDGKPYADPTKGEFSSLNDAENPDTSLTTVAGLENIQITARDDGTITKVEKMGGQDISDTISVDKDPGIGNMVTGNTITIGDDKTFTYVDPADVQKVIDGGVGTTFTIISKGDPNVSTTFTLANPADPANGTFSDMASLIEAGAAANPPLNLFSDADSLKNAAAKEGITLYIDPDSMKITTATKPGSNIFNGTFEEYYVSLDATLGMDIKSTSEKLDNYSSLAGSIYDERESVTGVSHDEEAMNLMRYQQAYTAASRLLTTLDQVLDILLTQTGMVGR